jgi:predicted nuclease of restriction endonuclease-like (RecB) superfamily
LLIGYYIVEFEQKGDDRAKYGDKLLEKLAQKILVKGFSYMSLSQCRMLYAAYPNILQTVSEEFKNNILQTLSVEFKGNIPETTSIVSLAAKKSKAQKHLTILFNQTSFSHLLELAKIDDLLKRAYYELLILKTGLSVRNLRRQIASLAYERTGLAKNKKLSLAKIEKQITPVKAADAIKDFYFFEFLDLPDKETVDETQLETALLNHLEKFILEMGNGFCFEARQKKIMIGGEYFSVDMVFYHRILHCHVLIDLKVDKFSHTHASQLNTYLNYYNHEVKEKADNPPIGILLVTDKNKALVEYASSGISQKFFVSKYLVHLPGKKQLENFIKRELRKI